MATYQDGDGAVLSHDEAVALAVGSFFSIEWDEKRKVNAQRTGENDWMVWLAHGSQRTIRRIGHWFDPGTEGYKPQETLSAAAYRAMFS